MSFTVSYPALVKAESVAAGRASVCIGLLDICKIFQM